MQASLPRIRGGTFGLAVALFLLPFVTVSCPGGQQTFSGLDLAFGTTVEEPGMFGPPTQEKVDGNPLALLALLCAVGGLVGVAMSPDAGRRVSAITGTAGALLLIVLGWSLKAKIAEQGGGMLQFRLDVGYWGALLANCVGAVLAVADSPVSRVPPIEPKEVHGEGPTGDEDASLGAGSQGQHLGSVILAVTAATRKQVRTWLEDLRPWLENLRPLLENLRLLERIKAHARVLGVGAGGFVLLWGTYAVFLKHRPEADGNAAAEVFQECQESYSSSVGAVYASFLSGFAAVEYGRRADARAELDGRLDGERSTYRACLSSAEDLWGRLQSRYSKPQDVMKFAESFALYPTRLSALEIEMRVQRYQDVLVAIDAVIPPVPDSERIVRDLIGKRIDGWRFAFESEIKSIEVDAPVRDGDRAVLRTNLDLEDFQTHARSYAILDVLYTLDEQGDWAWDQLHQLVFENEGTNYALNGEIFLVGRWRWSTNYATYFPNGEWSGQWDDGSSGLGTWSLVLGHLVLQRDGRQWQRLPIVRFSTDELVLGGIAEARAERVR